MKRFISLCVAAALILPVHAGAQVFNHLSLGIGGGTDALGLQLAAPLGSHVDVIAGYGLGLGIINIGAGSFSIPEQPGSASSTNVNVPLKLGFGMNDGRLLFNIYPGKGGFHFTVGAYMGSSHFVNAKLTGMPAVYNTAGIEVDDYLVKATNGELNLALCANGIGSHAFAVKPYVGIGYGRAISNKAVSFCVDLGAQYQGKPGVWAKGEGLTGRIQEVQITEKQLSEIGKLTDDYGKYMAFWPTLTFHLFVKLF
jgi:hypothetical protein